MDGACIMHESEDECTEEGGVTARLENNTAYS